MLERLPRNKRNVVLIVLGIFAVWFLWTIRAVVNPLLLGYLVAFILHPAVQRVRSFGLSHRAAVGMIFVLGFLATGATVFGVVWQMRHLANGIAENPKLRAQLEERVGQARASINEWLGPEFVPELDVGSLIEAAQSFLREEGEGVGTAAKTSLTAAGEALGMVGGWLGAIVGLIGALILIPIYTYFLLFELERIHATARSFLPRRDRQRLSDVATQIGGVISNFFRGRLSVCVLKGLFLTIGLLIAGVPYAFLFGMASGLLSLIPFAGPFIGFLGALLVATLEHGFGSGLLRTSIVFGLGEVLEGYVLIPKILGDSLGLHPVVVLFVILAGGASLGMLGVLIALPVAASLLIVFRELVLPGLQKSLNETEARA